MLAGQAAQAVTAMAGQTTVTAPVIASSRELARLARARLRFFRSLRLRLFAALPIAASQHDDEAERHATQGAGA